MKKVKEEFRTIEIQASCDMPKSSNTQNNMKLEN